MTYLLPRKGTVSVFCFSFVSSPKFLIRGYLVQLAKFSLLGLLNLDLELDDEVLAQAIAPPPPSRSFALTSHSTSPTIHNPIDFDPKQPFFFPGDLPTKAKTRKEGGNWRDP